jgi:ER-bound oxygenase mpaB/B'/Rubber oxygenase, catalytic domain
MRTLTKQQESYFDGRRRVGDDPLRSQLNLLGLNYENGVDYMKLVYAQGPDIGQNLLGDHVQHPKKAIYSRWWEETLSIGWSVLQSSYGGVAGAAPNVNAGPPPISEVLPSFPISELNQTRSLFHQYGSEIGSALLLAALPQAYATSWGARVLAATGHLQNDKPGDLTRRIRATAQFVTNVLGPSGFVKEGDPSNGDIENAWDPRSPDKGQAFRSIMGLRLLHQVIRTILTEQPGPRAEATEVALGPKNCAPYQPLNQEDLLATQLLFCITVFEVLEKFGLSWSTDDQMAYLTTWNLIGRLLGIEPPEVPNSPELDPQSVEGARRLLELLRIRQWKEVPPFVAEISVSDVEGVPLDDVWNSLRPGRRLTKALLDELASAMGTHFQLWPLATMRELAPQVVRDRLGLGASGICMSILDNLPRRTATIGWFTRIRTPNTVKATTIRFMANAVTRDAVISFLRSTEPPPFVLPGLEDWTASLPGVGQRSGT